MGKPLLYSVAIDEDDDASIVFSSLDLQLFLQYIFLDKTAGTQ